jgi:hypothetical protein
MSSEVELAELAQLAQDVERLVGVFSISGLGRNVIV